MQASSILVPSSHRVALCAGRKLQLFMEPLLEPPLAELTDLIKGIFPHGINPAMAKYLFFIIIKIIYKCNKKDVLCLLELLFIRCFCMVFFFFVE